MERCTRIKEACPFAPDCFMNQHHLYYPASNYRTQLEKAFRELPVNKEVICTYEHNLIHALDTPPNKPNHDVMLRAVLRPEE